MCGVTQVDSVRNEEVRRRIGVVRGVVGQVEQGVLRWLEHKERMKEEHLVKKIRFNSRSNRLTRKTTNKMGGCVMIA